MGKFERREIRPGPLSWSCPYCLRENGTPEVQVCKCGARKAGDTVIRRGK